MTAWSIATPPPNDDFAHRLVLSGPLPLSVNASIKVSVTAH